jgi:mRNA interferase MazF
LIVQDDAFAERDSITICSLTRDPNSRNGLSIHSWLMLDKLTTVRCARLGSRIGQLDGNLLVRLNRSILVFLGRAR